VLEIFEKKISGKNRRERAKTSKKGRIKNDGNVNQTHQKQYIIQQKPLPDQNERFQRCRRWPGKTEAGWKAPMHAKRYKFHMEMTETNKKNSGQNLRGPERRTTEEKSIFFS
jgi:hypothetical protein